MVCPVSVEERKTQYNQGDLIRFQRKVWELAVEKAYLCVITEVLTFGDWPDKHYRIQWIHDGSYQVYESNQVDSDPNFKLLARGQ